MILGKNISQAIFLVLLCQCGCRHDSVGDNCIILDAGHVFVSSDDPFSYLLSRTFCLTNPSDSAARVEILSTTCGCAEVTTSKKILGPKEPAEVTLTISLGDDRELKREIAYLGLIDNVGRQRSGISREVVNHEYSHSSR